MSTAIGPNGRHRCGTCFAGPFLLVALLMGSLATAGAQSLGKDADWFQSRYESVGSSVSAKGHWVMAPFAPPMIKLGDGLIFRRYESSAVVVEALFVEQGGDAIWARVSRAEQWSPRDLSEALSLYGSQWSSVSERAIAGRPLTAEGQRSIRRSREGTYSWFVPEAKQLILFSGAFLRYCAIHDLESGAAISAPGAGRESSE